MDGPATLAKGQKYRPLADWLARQRVRTVAVHFAAIEDVIGANLPPSAFRYPAWWANHPGHVAAQAWLSVGWCTSDLDLTERMVIFRKGT